MVYLTCVSFVIDTYGKLENQNLKFRRVYFHAFVCELDATS